MQCKYAFILFLPELHIKLFKSRKKKKVMLSYAFVRKHIPLSDLRVPFEEYM
jgi:hypothetical protein